MKRVIALSGGAGSEKSSAIRTVRLVRDLLISKYPNAKVINLDPSLRVGITISVTIGTRQIGITSQGDVGQLLRRSLKKFVSNGCMIIVCPIRTRGRTLDAVKRLVPPYELILIINPPRKRSEYDSNNKSDAKAIVAEIEEALNSKLMTKSHPQISRPASTKQHYFRRHST